MNIIKSKAGRITLGIILLFVATVASYVMYVFLTYYRLDSKMGLKVTTKGTVEEMVKTETEYKFLTYNIGFGAYSSDYSFFMDGGKYSRAFSEEEVVENINGSIQTMQKEDADFIFLQEVDLKATRSYGVDENEMILDAFSNIASAFAVNYDSPYLMYPLTKPHGKSKSGMSTISKFNVTGAVRRGLPIDTSIYKLIDLDRCFTVTKVPVENGKTLCLYNVHLSAYTKDESIVENQIKKLSEDMKKQYEQGNYVVCGGDFNQDLLGNSPEVFGTPVIEDNWAKAFPSELLADGFSVVFDQLSEEEKRTLVPSCRNADAPYNEETTFVTMVDGFIISDNVELAEVVTVDNQFAYSDHNPVTMSFRLKAE